jgi:glycosyltransferase involved in cell wall biosynthesis
MTQTIWYVSKYIIPTSGHNPGSRGFSLMKEMSEKGFSTIIISSDSNALHKVPILDEPYLLNKYDKVLFVWVKTFKYSVSKSLRRILSWLHFELRLFLIPDNILPKPDVVIISSLSLLTIFNGFFFRKKYGCKLIFEVRDIWPLTLTAEGSFSRFNPLVIALGLVEKIAYKHADFIVGTMPNLKAHVDLVLGKDTPVHCIPMGVDYKILVFSNDINGDFQDYKIPKDKFIVGYAGTIGITNALEVLFRCAEMLEGDSKIHFVILGDGDLLPFFKEKYSFLSNITFIPKVAKNAVQSVLKNCDVLYFSTYPSLVWQYGQSLNKVIEYMCAGKPIIASYTGYQSMINEARCGSFVPAGDPMALKEELLSYAKLEESEIQKIGKRGRVWVVKNRSYKKLAEKYIEIMFGRQQ